jgi:hypothetical protein
MRPLGRSRHREEEFFKWFFKKWAGDMDWIYLDQDRNKVGLLYMR